METKIIDSANKIEKKPFWKVFTIAIVIELILMLLIFFLDKRPCPSEEYSLKWMQAVQLLLVAFLAFKIYKINQGKIKSFWALVAIAFSWATLDELFMIHERIADNWLSNTLLNSIYPYPLDSFVIAIYFVIGIVFLVYFIKPLYNEYRGEKWPYILIFAILMHAYSAFADVMSWSCSEEYAEAFAGLFYLLSFVLAYITKKNKK